MSLLADMIAKPADLGEQPKVTRSSIKSSSTYYSKLNAIKVKEEKVLNDTTKLEPGIHDRLNQGQFFVNESLDSSLNILAFDSSSRDPDICSKYN